MTPQLEPDRVLLGPSRACLFVSQGGETPRGWPFIVRWIDGALWSSTYVTSAKMRHIRAADQASCLVFVDESTAFPYAVVHGRIDVLEPTPDLVDRWMGGSAIASVRADRHRDRLLSGKRVFLVLRPDAEPTVFATASHDGQGRA